MKVKRIILSITMILMICMSIIGCSKNSSGNSSNKDSSDGIKIGVLFSVSGSTAITEKSMYNATMLAIDEVNKNGGINGKKLIAIHEDYSSDPAKAAEKAKKLIMQDGVVAIIGCYTSASRQAVLPVVESNKSLLIYPTYYEGEELSPNIIYTGSTPNQQATDFIPWLVKNIGKKVFFIGSDYVFPVTCNKQAKMLLAQNGGEVVGEEYVPMGHSEFSSIINKIKEAKPDMIYSDLVGDSVVAFYKQYKNYGLSPETCPIVSLSTDEASVKAMGAENAAGHYTSMPYFSTIDTPENKAFLDAYNAKYKDDSTVTCVAEASYNSVKFLEQALSKVADYKDSKGLIEAFKGLELKAPQGTIRIDTNNHTQLYSRIGKVNDKGLFDMVYVSKEAIKPEPWPTVLYPDGPPKK